MTRRWPWDRRQTFVAVGITMVYVVLLAVSLLFYLALAYIILHFVFKFW